MGSNLSQEKIDSVAYGWYQTSLQQSCVLPDVGIDESLMKFSGINSNYELQSYSKELLNDVPRYVSAVGAAFGSLNSVPNAVGLGALVISMILELIVKFSTLGQQREDSYAIFRRVFGEEKASSVRDTMAEYVKRHVTFINNNRLLLEELHRLETQLSGHLTILKNSLLYDEQMSSRGFKIWVNGASFHIQMLIHEARLRSQTGQATSGYVTSISALIGVYLRDLDLLLNQYASYKVRKTKISSDVTYSGSYMASSFFQKGCSIKNTELNCNILHRSSSDPCESHEMVETYVRLMLREYYPVSSLRSHFVNIKNNLVLLISQRYVFNVPRTK